MVTLTIGPFCLVAANFSKTAFQIKKSRILKKMISKTGKRAINTIIGGSYTKFYQLPQ